jgi:hypothetical protein
MNAEIADVAHRRAVALPVALQLFPYNRVLKYAHTLERNSLYFLGLLI